MEEQVTAVRPGLYFFYPGKCCRQPGYGIIPAVFVLFIMLFPVYLDAADVPPVFSPEKILSFAEYLIDTGEYYRAGVELRRLSSYYPGFVSEGRLRVTGMYLLYKSGRFHDITDESVVNKMDCLTGIFMFDSFLLTGNYSGCRTVLNSVGENCDDDLVNGIYRKRKAGLMLLEGNVTDTDTGELYRELVDMDELASWSSAMNESKKSPVLAALLGIFPGMGYIYADDAGTGFVAMTVIGLSGAVTWGSFKNDIEPLGIISGVVTAFFYGGNIAGGYIQTRKYNGAIEEQVQDRIRNELGMEKDIDRIYIRFGISSHER